MIPRSVSREARRAMRAYASCANGLLGLSMATVTWMRSKGKAQILHRKDISKSGVSAKGALAKTGAGSHTGYET